MPTVAPYGSWPSPIDAATRGPRRAAAGGAGDRRGRRGLVGRGPARRGRPGGADAAAAGRRAGDGDAGGDERAHPRPRVRRRRLAPGRRRTSSSSSTSPTSGSTGSGSARSRWRSRRSRRSRGGAALRRHAADAGRRARSSACARPTASGEAGERDRRAAARRLGRAAGARRRARLLLLPRGSAPTAPGSPGPAGTTRTCPGTGPSCGWRRSPTPARRGLIAGGAGGVDLPARVGRRTGASTSSPTATAGGTSTAREPGAELSGEEGALVQLTDEQADLGHPQWLFGGSTYAFLEDGAIVCVRCERGEERLFLLEPAAPGTGATSACPYTSFGFPLALRPRRQRVAFAAASPEQRDRGRRLRRRAAARPRWCGSASDEPVDPAYVSRAAPDRVPDRRRRGRLRLLLPAGQPRVRGAGGRTAAADRREPRRPDLPRHPGARPRVPLLDQPRHRRRRRQLPRLQRLRPRLPQQAARRPGASSTPKTASTRRCHLAATGEADGERLAIRGGSAGGYATLCALTFHDDFAAGASYYGVADAETLAGDTHKFESRYLDGLIGPYPEQRRPLPRALADPLRRAAAGRR